MKTGLKAGQKRGKAVYSEKFYTWKRDVPPKTEWSIKAGRGVSKAGRRDIAVEFGTVPPKAGRLTRMQLQCLVRNDITDDYPHCMPCFDGMAAFTIEYISKHISVLRRLLIMDSCCSHDYKGPRGGAPISSYCDTV